MLPKYQHHTIPSECNDVLIFFFFFNLLWKGSPVLPKYLRPLQPSIRRNGVSFLYLFHFLMICFRKKCKVFPSVTTQWLLLCVCIFGSPYSPFLSAHLSIISLICLISPPKFYELFVIEENKNIHFIMKRKPHAPKVPAPPNILGARWRIIFLNVKWMEALCFSNISAP